MTNPPLRVAVIEPVGGHGGMDYYDFGLCGGLAAAGLDVTLFTCDETRLPVDARFRVRHTYAGIYGKAPAWRRGLRYLKGTLAALCAARWEGRRICHFHLFHVGPLQAFNVAMAKLFMLRVAITAHDVESFVERLEVPVLSRWVYRQAAMVIAHNEVSRQELIDRIELPAERVVVVPHGNYLHALHPLPPVEEARKALHIPQSAKVLLFFGQIKEVKGLDLLLEAMPDVLQSHPEVFLLIAGRPWKSDFGVYEAMIDRLGIRNHCLAHIRYIADEEVPFFYAAADLVVLPYRAIYQSGVLLMAMSYKKAVLVSDLPGMTEIVEDKVTGYVFRKNDFVDLAGKLNFAMVNFSFLENLAVNGFVQMWKNYSWDIIGKKIGIIYVSIDKK